MPTNIIKLLKDFNIPFATEGHKHTTQGWVNVNCPFCPGTANLHLGINLTNMACTCWRCGGHPTMLTLARLLKITVAGARAIARNYGGSLYSAQAEVKIRAKAFKLPTGTGPLNNTARHYLMKRNFEPERLSAEWGLMSTGPSSFLDHINFRHRVVAPIFWNGEMVSFQARDWTGKSDLRYITCPKDRELAHHKEILYGRQAAWGNSAICTEGITDVWRLGTSAFATFGIEYTRRQLTLIAKTFKEVFVMFDDDPQAIVQADKLVHELLFRGVKAQRIDIKGDPGGLAQADANYLVKQLLGR